ncbi:MAG: cytochrome c oxidase subunit II, partial [Myxococcales bacterium]
MSRALPLALLAVLAAACTGPQGVLRNEGPAARVLSELLWRLFFTTVIPAALVILFVVWLALRKKAEVQPPAPGRDVRFIVVAGALFPGAVLLMLTVFTIQAGEGTRRPPREPALRVEVIGHQFWWEVRYPDHDVVTANEIHVPAGEPVQLEVTSADVIHSFWVPALHGKIDMIPGKTNVFWFQADRPGEYRGQCAEFCGQQHALMALLVVAEPADALPAAWVQCRASRVGVGRGFHNPKTRSSWGSMVSKCCSGGRGVGPPK